MIDRQPQHPRVEFTAEQGLERLRQAKFADLQFAAGVAGLEEVDDLCQVRPDSDVVDAESEHPIQPVVGFPWSAPMRW